MNYDFYASAEDKIDVLNFIFNETDLRIFDSASLFDEEVCEYKNVDEIKTKFDLQNSVNSNSITFQLWSPLFKAKPDFRKIILNPKYCKGHTFRYTTAGWELIQLYFKGIHQNALHRSHIGHFNRKGALKWEGINKDNGKVDDWDWEEIEKTSRKLKYHIHNKLAVKNLGSSGVLSGAEILEQNGTILTPLA